MNIELKLLWKYWHHLRTHSAKFEIQQNNNNNTKNNESIEIWTNRFAATWRIQYMSYRVLSHWWGFSGPLVNNRIMSCIWATVLIIQYKWFYRTISAASLQLLMLLFLHSKQYLILMLINFRRCVDLPLFLFSLCFR